MNKGLELEEYVHYIYDRLLNMKDEGVVVTRDAKIFSRDGIAHQIDIYYEFTNAGISHKVAIECKNTERPIEKGKVQEFESKIRDLVNITGVIISKNGYQKKAKEFAIIKGILPLTSEELPSMPQLMADRLKTVCLPDESCIGEPFWAVMEVENGRVTGSFMGTTLPENNKPSVLLFFSKKHAELSIENSDNREKWAVRGLPQYSLRAFLIWVQTWNWDVRICFRFPGDPTKDKFGMFPITMKEFRDQYYLKGDLPEIAEIIL